MLPPPTDPPRTYFDCKQGFALNKYKIIRISSRTFESESADLSVVSSRREPLEDEYGEGRGIDAHKAHHHPRCRIEVV